MRKTRTVWAEEGGDYTCAFHNAENRGRRLALMRMREFVEMGLFDGKDGV